MSLLVKTENRQVELKFQNHIIGSYETHGGHAAKWGSEFQKGKPDLICCLPVIGVHLLEVKHLPIFGVPSCPVSRNTMSTKQRDEAKLYKSAGGFVMAAVVGFNTHANKSKLALFETQYDTWDARSVIWADYVAGKGYDVVMLIGEAMERKND